MKKNTYGSVHNEYIKLHYICNRKQRPRLGFKLLRRGEASPHNALLENIQERE